MALNFPDSPANGDTATLGGKTWTYNTSKTQWSTSSASGGGSSVTVSDTAPATPSDGDQWYNSLTLKMFVYYNDGSSSQWVVASPQSPGPVGAVGPTGGAGASGVATVLADMAALVAVTGMTAGQTALVTGLNKLFMYTGSAWFLIATMTNASPTAITGVNATYPLATDGTATVVTVSSTDPEGFPLTFSHAITTGTLGSTATVVQGTGANTNVFTITPSTVEANAGSFSITFSVTDGATGAVNSISAFTLAFQMDGTLSYYVPARDQSQGDGFFGRGVACNNTYSFFLGSQDSNIDATTGTQTDQIVAHSNSDGSYVKSFNTGAGGRVGSDNELACNETYVASKRYANNVYLWNISTGAIAHQFTLPVENSNTLEHWGAGPSRGAISLSPSYIAIGSRSYDANYTNTGAVYVYNASDFSLRYKALPSSSQTYNYCQYGHGNITDTHLIMGNMQNGSTSNADYVYVFNNSDGSLLHTISQPSSHPKAQHARFGHAVAINNNNYFAIGNSYYQTGAVHVYNTTTGALRYTITNAYTDWGETVSMSNDLIAISGYSNYGGNNLTIHNLSDGSIFQDIGNHTPTGGSFAGQQTPTHFARSISMNRSGTAMAVSDRDQKNTLGTVGRVGVGFIYK